ARYVYPAKCSTQRLKILVSQHRLLRINETGRAASQSFPRFAICRDLDSGRGLKTRHDFAAALDRYRATRPFDLANDFKATMFEFGDRNVHLDSINGHLRRRNKRFGDN